MIQDELYKLDDINEARISLRHNLVTVFANKDISDDQIKNAIERAGYQVIDQAKPIFSRNIKDYTILLFGVFISVLLFWLASKLNISPNIYSSAGSELGYAIIMGLAAGFSTCMALVGGIVAGVAAKHKAHYPKSSGWQSFRPHIIFNIGRIVGFLVLGGILGLVGSALTFSPIVIGVLTILASVFMLVIGLQLTGIFPRLTMLSLPSKIFSKIGLDRQKPKTYSDWRTLGLGALTFFLPCGFTQAMQLFAVSTGSALSGALVMGLFAIGTTPGLLLVGGLVAFIRGQRVKTMLKVIGAVIIVIALYIFSSGLAQIGLQLPNLKAASTSRSNIPAYNIIKLTFKDTYQQFDKTEIVLLKNQSYRIEISPEADGKGCMSTISLPGLTKDKIQLIKKNKKIIYEFTADRAGSYKFICAMGIAFNTNIVVNES